MSHEKSDDFPLKGKANTHHLHRRVEPEIDTKTSKIIGSSLNVSDFITKEIFRNAQDEAALASSVHDVRFCSF